MKKIIFLLSLIFTLCSCSQQPENNDKIQITTTIFPQYDFAKQISGDLADVSMLLPVGAEGHTYEPTSNDILKIENSDIFIYTGGESDNWIDDILNNISNKELKIICLMDFFEDIKNSENVHTIDEHIWTSPKNALKISQEIKNVLLEVDNKNCETYENNFKLYREKLISLDENFINITNNSKRNTLVFGDRFPFKYLTEEYDLSHFSAFTGCSEETEPNIKTVMSLIDKVKSEEIPIVFYTDFSNHKIADIICSETGAELSMLRSCHSITKEEFENNVTYIDLMNENAQKIEEALN